MQTYIRIGAYIAGTIPTPLSIARSKGDAVKDLCKVLFLCTGNSARSILAEALLNHKGRGRFAAYSAGSHPAGAPRREALAELAAAGIATAGLRSKSWEEFAAPGAPQIDFIFTVCDNAAHEACPLWPGRPITTHWGVADPAAVKGTSHEIARAFHEAFTILERRIDLLLALPLAELDARATEQQLKQIGRA